MLVLMTSPVLDVDRRRRNGTRQIMEEHRGTLHFRKIDPEKVLRESPFGERADEVKILKLIKAH